MEPARPRTDDPAEPTRVPNRPADFEVETAHAAQERTAVPGGTTAVPSLPAPGMILGKYRLLQPIGSGSSCVVYKAEHLKLPMPVAVKIPRLAEVENTAALREQLRTEAALLAHVNHPNLLRLWDYDDDPYPYLVVEYVAGSTLGQVMRTQAQRGTAGPGRPPGGLPAGWVLQLAYHAAKGLKAAHQMGIVHRDLKPENVMVTDDGLVKVADLGLGSALGRLLKGVGRSSTHGSITGTAAYIAPEQALNADAADHRADIYSLGATVYHAVAGQMPFAGRSPMEVILRHINEPLRPLIQVVPGVKREISDLVGKMLSKRPDNRHPTYDDLLGHIRLVLKA